MSFVSTTMNHMEHSNIILEATLLTMKQLS